MIINPYAFGGSSAVGYLDGLATQPGMALSLRKVISTATDSIRVRRSNDNAEQDIGFAGDVLDTSALGSFVGSNSAFVAKVYDQTGNGFDAVQATSASQPRIVNAGTYDGQLVFDGSDDFLQVASLTNNAPQAGIYSKVKQSVGSAKIIFETSANYNSNAGSFLIYADSGDYGIGMCQSSGSTHAISYLLGLTTLKQLTVLYDRSIVGSTEIAAYVGGSLSAQQSLISGNECTGNFSTYDMYIGARAGSSLFADMWLESLVFYPADTASIRTSIEAFVA